MEDPKNDQKRKRAKAFAENRTDPAYAPQPDARNRQRNYGEIIRAYREKAQISQLQLSQDLGFSSSYFANLEHGYIANPRVDTVVPICRYLQIPLNEFFGLEESTGLTMEESELLRGYRGLSPAMQKALMTIIRNSGQENSDLQRIREDEESQKVTLKEGPMAEGENPEKPKRGRGRPPRERDPNEEQKPKRPRGRPRKNQ